MSGRAIDSWVTCPSPNPRAQLRLFCFPYAGGGVPAFRGWADDLPTTVEVCPIQLPGRGTRWKEPPFTRLLALVEAAAQALRPHLDKPFAVYGHSMGAIIGFELARHLRRTRAPEPAGLFVSGARAPHRFVTEQPIHGLATPAFLDGLRRFGGAPQQVLESAELMQLLLPMLRADFAVCETYAYAAEAPLDCPLWAYGGTQDHIAPWPDLEAWRAHTTGTFSLRSFSGGHFFIEAARTSFFQLLSADLTGRVRQL